jgi:hypothetical protein
MLQSGPLRLVIFIFIILVVVTLQTSGGNNSKSLYNRAEYNKFIMILKMSYILKSPVVLRKIAKNY